MAVKRIDVLNACRRYIPKTPHMPTNVELPSVYVVQIRVRHQSRMSNSMVVYLRTSRRYSPRLNSNIPSDGKARPFQCSTTVRNANPGSNIKYFLSHAIHVSHAHRITRSSFLNHKYLFSCYSRGICNVFTYLPACSVSIEVVSVYFNNDITNFTWMRSQFLPSS